MFWVEFVFSFIVLAPELLSVDQEINVLPIFLILKIFHFEDFFQWYVLSFQVAIDVV